MEPDTVSVVVDTPTDDNDAPDVVVVETPSPASEITPIDVDLVERVTRLETRVEVLESATTQALITAEVAEETASAATDIAIDAITEVAEVLEDAATEPEPEPVAVEDDQAPRSVSHPFFRPSHEWSG